MVYHNIQERRGLLGMLSTSDFLQRSLELACSTVKFPTAVGTKASLLVS